MRKIYCIVLLLMATVAIYAQAPDCPKDTVNGEEVYKYQVEKSIGLYRIGVNFNVPQSEIIRMNPQLKERGLHYGETILIPTGRKVEKKRETKPEVLKEIEHAKMVESAKVADPVKITEPVKTPEPKVEPVDTVAITEAVPAPMDTVVEPAPAAEAESVSRKVIELALMLPFESRQTKRSANAEKMVDFYQGALLALHDLQDDSILYRLRVYDTERSDRRVTTLTLGRDLDSVQAILGLAYPIQVAVLAPWCEEHHVPLITPFMDELDLTGFSQLMLFNAGDQQQADSLCNWVLSQPDIHCVNVEANDIVSTPTIRTLRKTMRLKGIDIFALSLSDLMADSATYALDKQKENLIILHSNRFNQVRPLMPHLESLQEAGYRIRIVSQYAWQKENIVLPQVFTSLFTCSGDREAYENLWKMYFAQGHASQTPRYDLLGYDLMQMLVLRLKGATTYKGLQSDIEFRQEGDKNGWHNVNVKVIVK